MVNWLQNWVFTKLLDVDTSNCRCISHMMWRVLCDPKVKIRCFFLVNASPPKLLDIADFKLCRCIGNVM